VPRVREVLRVATAVARHPSLWPVALRQIRRTAPGGWWRRAPFLPLPAADYLSFRLVTQYGDERHPIDPGDVLDYLLWCRGQA
jgi:hypothetical protein